MAPDSLANPMAGPEPLPRAGGRPITITFDEVQTLAEALADEVAAGGVPQVVVAIARGGLVPAVLVSHLLGVREVRMLPIVHTLDDRVAADKLAQPRVTLLGCLGELAELDVLIVDDIAGSGATLRVAREAVAEAGAARIRVAVLVVNEANWVSAEVAPEHVGRRVRGWVIFPWEVAP